MLYMYLLFLVVYVGRNASKTNAEEKLPGLEYQLASWYILLIHTYVALYLKLYIRIYVHIYTCMHNMYIIS